MCVSVSSIVLLSPQLGLDMEELEEIEEDAGLGNGGLGRLAGKHSRNGLYHLGDPSFSSAIHNMFRRASWLLRRRRQHGPSVDLFLNIPCGLINATKRAWGKSKRVLLKACSGIA